MLNVVECNALAYHSLKFHPEEKMIPPEEERTPAQISAQGTHMQSPIVLEQLVMECKLMWLSFE